MKISEYAPVTSLTSDNIMLIDGNLGTKNMKVQDFITAVLDLTSVRNHRQIFRGKNLGTTVTLDQKSAIQDGTFKDLWLGDYWEVDGIKYRIADFDYWYNKGNPALTQHHLIIVPDIALYSASMNATSVTTGGYTSSQMYTTNLTQAKSTITTIFGDDIITHKDYLINEVTSGYPSNGAYVDSSIELMNELMVYGSYIYTPASNGTTDVKRYTINNAQLALFSVAPEFLVTGNGFWLRDVASASHFARVDMYGGATSTGAANSYGVRPVFAIG